MTTEEKEVLDYINDDPSSWFNSYETGIVKICGNLKDAELVCRSLRKKKLVDARGRGKFAQYASKM